LAFVLVAPKEVVPINEVLSAYAYQVIDVDTLSPAVKSRNPVATHKSWPKVSSGTFRFAA